MLGFVAVWALTLCTLEIGKRRYNIKLWKTFTDCFNCLPIAAIIDEKIFTMHGGLSPDLQSMEQIRRVMRPTDVPDTGAFLLQLIISLHAHSMVMVGLLCDLLWSDPDKDITGWSENDRGVSFTFGPDVVSRFLQKHDMDLICRAHQVRYISKHQSLQLNNVLIPRPFCRLSKTDTNSLQNDTWWHYFRRQITVENLTMPGQWWVSTRHCCVPSKWILTHTPILCAANPFGPHRFWNLLRRKRSTLMAAWTWAVL